MLTVTQLARACGVSRTTVLYYESLGLLPAPSRSPGNYRVYRDTHLQRLRRICALRGAGLALADVGALLDEPSAESAASVLNRRLAAIAAEMERLKDHQRAVLRLLKHPIELRSKDMDKAKWVAIMKAAGFGEEEMHRWHVEFERAAPDDHQEFLQYLQIPADGIARIRAWSRT